MSSYYYTHTEDGKKRKNRTPKIFLFTTIFLSIVAVALVYGGLSSGWFGDNKGVSIEKQVSELIYGKSLPQRKLSYIPEIIADNESSKLILAVLNDEDIKENVINHIKSITVVEDLTALQVKCAWMGSGACAINKGNSRDFVTEIYMPSPKEFKGNWACSSFEHVLYHEIGHVDYNVNHAGELSNNNEIEYFVENFADKYNKFKKDTCPESLRLFH